MTFGTCIKVTEWMSGFDGKWGIAGGWALDLFIGKETRSHSDIEVAIIREDQHMLKKALADRCFKKVVNGELILWEQEWLELPIHEIHGVHEQSGDRLEVLLNETIDGEWIFRREPSILFPESSLFLASNDRIPYLHPVVVLLYKAKNAREKDHSDFFTTKGLLKVEDRNWLRNALQIHLPGHMWISQL